MPAHRWRSRWSTWRKSGTCIGGENSGNDQPSAGDGNKPRSPGAAATRSQRLLQADSTSHVQDSADDEVGDLEPAEGTKAEQADRVSTKMNPVRVNAWARLATTN